MSNAINATSNTQPRRVRPVRTAAIVGTAVAGLFGITAPAAMSALETVTGAAPVTTAAVVIAD